VKGLVPLLSAPTTPNRQRHQALTPARFGLIPFRSPLLRESLLLSSPRGTEMFQFPRFPLSVLCVQTGVTPHYGCRVSPFGRPRIEARSAAPRGLSQPPTSFFGFRRQGIHRWLFVAWRTKMLVLAMEFSKGAHHCRRDDDNDSLPVVGARADKRLSDRDRLRRRATVVAPSKRNSEVRRSQTTRNRGRPDHLPKDVGGTRQSAELNERRITSDRLGVSGRTDRVW
jgi:hypothetical protein